MHSHQARAIGNPMNDWKPHVRRAGGAVDRLQVGMPERLGGAGWRGASPDLRC